MNAMMNTTSVIQVDNNDLRDLSQVERAKVNGGANPVCYRNASGYNTARLRLFNNGVVRYELWRGGDYADGYKLEKTNDFIATCRQNGFPFIYNYRRVF
jgi:hypothetical protein